MVLQIRGLRKCRSFIESINRGGVKKNCKSVLINNMVAGFLIVSLLPMKELGKECNRSLLFRSVEYIYIRYHINISNKYFDMLGLEVDIWSFRRR